MVNFHNDDSDETEGEQSRWKALMSQAEETFNQIWQDRGKLPDRDETPQTGSQDK